ncbi:Nitrite-sensitive transcriptional repressor NsrR [gamma proteobacterium IMCC2047]|nr:Nitrite-sensitive transcriptional repressor NsrR [gamma proteobacterium IMCC2047]
MQLTRHTDYAFRVLIYLSSVEEGKLSTVGEIAEIFQVPINHLTKVVQQLGKAGFIITLRGKNGGIRLAHDPESILLGSVVRAMEATLDPVNCSQPLCRLKINCRLKPILNRAIQSFIETLDEYTLADISQNKEVQTLLVKEL